MVAKQSKTPSAIGESGVMYGFDPSNSNLVNAVKVNANGAILTSGGAGGGGSSDTSEATQLLVLAELESLHAANGSTSVTEAVPIGGRLANGMFRHIEVNASGHVNVSDGGGSLTVDGPLTDAQLRANTVQVTASNITTKFREAFETYDPVSGGRWSEVLGSGDIIAVDGNAAGSSYLVISKNPLVANTISSIETINTFSMPFESSIGLSMSQRTLGQEFAVEYVSNETPLTAPADITISSISQTTTTLSITASAAHNLKPGMRIGIKDCTDSRMNYPSLVVATTPTSTTLTCTAGPNGNLPSLTVGPFTSGSIYFRSALGYAPNGASKIFENATVTNASYYVRSESGDALPSGTITGNHSVTIATSASIQAINAALTYAFQPTTEYRFSLQADKLQWADHTVDAIVQTAQRSTRTQVIPNPEKFYKFRIRATNNAGLTVPVAHIQSVSKSGSTTATVVTQTPHGLTTGDVIAAYGVRDTTNFANLTAATTVASVIDSTTFTVIWGSAVTATSQSGIIYRVNGGNLPSALGAITQVVQSVSRTSDILTVVGSASWTGMLIGDYVNLAALHDTGGTDLNLDGAYRVRDIQTTNLFLEPLAGAPTGSDIVSTNCGGAVIKRTDMRISFVRIFDFERQRVEMLARPSGDISSSTPVQVSNVPAVTVSSGTVTTVTTVTTVAALTGGGAAEDAVAGANPVVVGGVVRTAAAPATLVAGDAARDTMTSAGAKTMALGASVNSAEVASAARTATGNSGTISVPTGGSISGLVVISASSGTSPTLDLTLEESYDNGTTWSQIWAAPRITGTGNTPIPALLVTGLRRWVWTITGTSPSFTFAINTCQLPYQANLIRSSFDRTAGVLSGTLNATTTALNIAGTSLLQAKVQIGAATTPGTYQLQVSDDNSNWVSVGTATPAVASSTVTFGVQNILANWARVIVTSAATSQTGGYVSIIARE